MAPWVATLRRRKALAVIERAFHRARGKFGLRLVDFSVEQNHLHLLVESPGKDELRRGITGLNVRLARGLNKVSGQRGQVIGERYHVHVLRTPTEVRNAVHYVRNNHAHHGGPAAIHPYCSLARPDLVVEAQTWLLREGWRRARAPNRHLPKN